MLARYQNIFRKVMEYIVIFLMITLSALVVIAVIYRKSGMSLSWYDEVASVLLAWLTYYASALAALTRGHIGFNGLLNALKPSLRIPFLIIGETLVIAFFLILAWMGMRVMAILGGDNLISLTWVPTRLTQSVIPVGAALFIIGQLLSLPEIWRQAMSGKGVAGHDDVEIPDEDPQEAVEGVQP